MLEPKNEEIDDTAAADANAVAMSEAAVPPAGFEISETTLSHKNDMIGPQK